MENQSIARTWVVVIAAIFLCSFAIVLGQETKPADIDWPKAQMLHQKLVRGETLTPDEKAYVQRAQAEIDAGRGPDRVPGGPATQGGNPAIALPVPPLHDHLGLLPLDQMTAKDTYKGEDGGLYGEGKNTPPPAQLKAAQEASARIQPLDQDGKAAANGKIVLMSVGMSNTASEFERFKALADAAPNKNPALVLVNGAQGGMTADYWAKAESRVWTEVQKKLQAAGVSEKQVQVIWLKGAIGGPGRAGDFPASAQRLREYLTENVHQILSHYPNVRIIYMSSRIYGGYASVALNPEPYAYESAFAVRWVIEDQMKGDATLNFDPAKNDVKAPVLLWGPYLWADGVKGRKSDALIWNSSDFGSDGTHPSPPGREKVVQMLLNFFKTDSLAKSWFTQNVAGKDSSTISHE